MSEQAPTIGPESGQPEVLVGSLVAGRYQVEELIGSGGMGAVFRATHVQLRKAVAVKVLHRQMSFLEEVVARFEREAIAAARVEHPHVAAATDFGKLDDGTFYLVLEYVAGRSLTSLFKEGPIGAVRALRISKQIAQALDAAHAIGIVHRDLKPDNVMLIEKADTKDFVKVLDFGIAKVTLEDQKTSPALTQLGTVFGTPQYMAPEQARGEAVDLRADLYALGVMLYEMLVGKTPFDSDDIVALLTRQMVEAPPPLPSDIDPELAALVMRLLEKDPGARVQTAKDLIEHFELILERLDPSTRSNPPATSPSPPPVSEVISAASSEDLATSATVVHSPAVRAAPPPSISDGLSTLGRALMEEVDVGRRRLPAWVLAAAAIGAFGFVVTILAWAVFGSSPSEKVAEKIVSVPGVDVEPVEPSIVDLLEPAVAGDPEALAALEERKDSERTDLEWLALGKGRFLTGRVRDSLRAYEAAVDENPELASDRVLLEDVYEAATQSGVTETALVFAGDKLGESGADLLFAVWTATNKKTRATERAKSLLFRKDTLAGASPELRLALDLRRTKKCKDLKELVEKAVDIADARSVKALKLLKRGRGCGFLGLGDCYSCLRKGTLLKDAQEAAMGRDAPSFKRTKPRRPKK